MLWRALVAALLQAETCVLDAVACFGCSLAAGSNVCIRMLWRALVAALLEGYALQSGRHRPSASL
jgi:hypothetical protein